MKIYLAKGSDIKLQLSKVVKYMNSKCRFLKFEELPISFNTTEDEIVHPITHQKYLKHIQTHLEAGEYIIYITETPYDNNFFYNEEKGLVILFFFAWQYLTSLPKENGLVYFICSMFIQEVIPSGTIDHTKRLGCVNDFLADKTRVDDGMRKGHLCTNCKQYIKSENLSEIQSQLYSDISTMLKDLSIASKDETNIVGSSKVISTAIISFVVKKGNNNKNKGRNNKNLTSSGGASVFISYSHKDERDRINLESHLKILQRNGVISTWTDRNIDAGDEWRREIDRNLINSQIILMLISKNFIASEYCYETEMKTALKRHKSGNVIAIPIILRDCFWQISPFAKLQALPQDGKPIQKFTRKDEAYTAIARAIWKIIQEKFM